MIQNLENKMESQINSLETRIEKMQDFPGGSEGKASACNVGDPGSIPGSGRSTGEGNGNPLQYSCLENPMDEGACYSPCGRKELDTTERLQSIRRNKKESIYNE